MCAGARVLVVVSPTVHNELAQLWQAHGSEALPQQLLDQVSVH